MIVRGGNQCRLLWWSISPVWSLQGITILAQVWFGWLPCRLVLRHPWLRALYFACLNAADSSPPFLKVERNESWRKTERRYVTIEARLQRSYDRLHNYQVWRMLQRLIFYCKLFRIRTCWKYIGSRKSEDFLRKSDQWSFPRPYPLLSIRKYLGSSNCRKVRVSCGALKACIVKVKWPCRMGRGVGTVYREGWDIATSCMWEVHGDLMTARCQPWWSLTCTLILHYNHRVEVAWQLP